MTHSAISRTSNSSISIILVLRFQLIRIRSIISDVLHSVYLGVISTKLIEIVIVKSVGLSIY